MRSEKINQFLKKLDLEDRIFVSRLIDMVDICEKCYTERFTFFIDKRQMELSKDIFNVHGFNNYLFYGGYDNAQRCILGIFPKNADINTDLFPLIALEFNYNKISKLSHKDFLGALMSRQIKRETIGDILIDDCKTVVFVYKTVSDMILNEVTKIGSAGVSVKISDSIAERPDEKFSEISGTVASLRVDAVVSLVLKISREKSAALIQSAGIEINYKKYYEPDKLLCEADEFSMRGYGKYIFYKANGKSKKGRIHISVKKYI